MEERANSRREFLKKTSLGGLGTLLGTSIAPSLFAETEAAPTANILSVHPRYYRWHVDPGVE